MARRTLEAMVGAVQRKLGGFTVGLGEIVEALAVANKEVHSKWDWPWTYGETLVSVPANYSTGTIAFTSGSGTFTGTGTVWDTTWLNRRVMTGSNSASYRVASITSPTTLTVNTLDTPNITQSGAGYVMYQDTYSMPADFEPGQDLILIQPQNRIRVPHIPRSSLEQQGIVLVQFFTTIPVGYADYGYNATTRRHEIKIIPPPGGVQQLRLVYRRMPIDLTTPTQYTEIPESFDDVLEWMATSDLAGTYGLGVQKMADAKAAFDARMDKVAIATFLATMRQAGHEAAKEAGLPASLVTA